MMTPTVDCSSAAAASAALLLGNEIIFPAGLLGFPDCQRYRLDRFEPGDGQESPFYVLNSIEHDLSFLLIHPVFVNLDYAVPVAPELLDGLAAGSGADLVPLLIVTLRDRMEEITVNLQGPLLIGASSRVGVQLVLENFPLRHPLIARGNF